MDNGGRADTVKRVDPYAGQSLNQWINVNAFADPCANVRQTLPDGTTTAIGRFGDSHNGAVVGPGTKAVSLSLLKSFTISLRLHVQLGAQAANVFHHPYYAPPGNLTLGVPAFGTISSMQTADGAGPRQIQLTARFTF